MSKKDDGKISVETVEGVFPIFRHCETHNTTSLVGVGVVTSDEEGQSSCSVGYSPMYTSNWEKIFGKKEAEELN